jgi:hypothetical protein
MREGPVPVTRVFDMVSLVGPQESEPVQVAADEIDLFTSWFSLLAYTYVPDGVAVIMEITPREEGDDR